MHRSKNVKKLIILFVAIVSFSTVSTAQVSDPNMTCSAYLELAAKIGPTPKTGDSTVDAAAAEIDKKMSDYCKSHPTEKAMDAAIKVMGG